MISIRSACSALTALTAMAALLGTASMTWAGDSEGFERVMAPFFRRHCLDCHDEATKSGLLSLEQIDRQVVSDDFETYRLIREQLQQGTMPPASAPQPAAVETAAALQWLNTEILKTQQPGAITLEKLRLPQFGNYVDHGLLFDRRLDHVVPAPPRLWRIRPDIYRAVMPPADGLANGLNMVDGREFQDYASAYFLDEAAASTLLSNAKKMAAALTDAQAKDKLLVRFAVAGTQQAEPVVNRLFQQLLGRQATEEERARFATFYQRSRQKAGRESAAHILITAILMQPEALFRQELGAGPADKFGRVRLSPRELGFALSFALADRPVTQLMSAAATNQLTTRDAISRVVREHLARARPVYPPSGRPCTFDNSPRLLQFFREYFDYPHVSEVFKDPPTGVGTHEPARLAADLELTILDIVNRDEQVLMRLLTTSQFYVQTKRVTSSEAGVQLASAADNRRTGFHTAYNLPIDWQWSAAAQPVTFPTNERAGVLTHPAWLAAWSGNFENHPVQRGKWIRTHLLGGTVPDVPIGVDARVLEREHTTFRDRLKLSTAAAECWRCHRKMDPLGVAFERYDHYGRFQRLDAGQPVIATAFLDGTGVPELDGRTFDGPAELMRFLARSVYVEQVFVRHAFRFFLGRNETLGDANTLQDAHRAYRKSGGSFKELVVALLSSDSFVYRKVPQP